jgi:hypothetical protein
MIPNAKIDAFEKAPPEHMSNNPSEPSRELEVKDV